MSELVCKKCDNVVLAVHHDGKCSKCFNFKKERNRDLTKAVYKSKNKKAYAAKKKRLNEQ